MPKQQKLIFTFEQTKDGKMKVSMDFYPKLAKNEHDFNALPLYIRGLQNAAADMGRFAMESMMKRDKK